MLKKIADILFGCGHGNYTFPLTIKPVRRRPWSGPTGTYVVCLDCGRELPYDWNGMRVAAAQKKGRAAQIIPFPSDRRQTGMAPVLAFRAIGKNAGPDHKRQRGGRS